MRDHLLSENTEEEIIFYDAINLTIETREKTKAGNTNTKKKNKEKIEKNDNYHTKNYCENCGSHSKKNATVNKNVDYDENVNQKDANIINEINIQIIGMLIFISSK